MIRPILFNTDMVKAILDGRKTATRRLLKLSSHVKVQDNGLYTLYAEGTCYIDQRMEEITEYLNSLKKGIFYISGKHGVNGQMDMYIKHGHHHFRNREDIQIK